MELSLALAPTVTFWGLRRPVNCYIRKERVNKLRELFSDTVIYGLSSVLARFFNYLLVPFHTGVFASSAYGVVSLVYSAIAFLNVLFTFGMESAYFRYAEDRKTSSSVYKTIQIALLGFASALVLMLWLGKPLFMPLMSLAESHAEIYLLMLGILWFDTLSIVPFAELRLARRAWLYATLRIVHVIVNVALNFYLILSAGFGIEAVFLANLVATVLVSLLVWWVTGDGWSGEFDGGVLKTCLQFGWPFVFSGFGHVTNEMLDRFFLNNMDESTIFNLYGASLTPEDIVGIYSACYKVAVFMMLLVQMFRMAWQPFFLRESDDPEAPRLYRDVFRYFNGVAGICFLIVALFAQQIVQIKIPFVDAYLVGEEYWMGLQIVPVLLGAYWFHGWYMNFSAGIFIREKTKVLPVITLIGAGITVASNLVLIPYIGMMGSAVATLISYAAMALLLYYQSTKIYPVDYQLAEGFGMMFLAVICLCLQPYLNQWVPGEWISRSILLVVGTAGFIWLSRPASEK